MRRRRWKRREREGIWRREDRGLRAVKEVQQASVLCVVLFWSFYLVTDRDRDTTPLLVYLLIQFILKRRLRR